jgi:phage terminase large subunit GpA-like protein
MSLKEKVHNIREDIKNENDPVELLKKRVELNKLLVLIKESR